VSRSIGIAAVLVQAKDEQVSLLLPATREGSVPDPKSLDLTAWEE
jgi:hypothetical protein